MFDLLSALSSKSAPDFLDPRTKGASGRDSAFQEGTDDSLPTCIAHSC